MKASNIIEEKYSELSKRKLGEKNKAFCIVGR